MKERNKLTKCMNTIKDNFQAIINISPLSMTFIMLILKINMVKKQLISIYHKNILNPIYSQWNIK